MSFTTYVTTWNAIEPEAAKANGKGKGEGEDEVCTMCSA